MNRSIWSTLPDNFTCLAPMEGVTDLVFRQVIAAAGRPDLFFTEFTNVSSYASERGRANALERLAIAPTDPPIIAQIWGKNPEHFAIVAQDLERLGFAGIDLNMGCPDRHVNAAGGGAAMIRTPELAVTCLRAAKAASDLPVSVKTRLGYTSPDEFRTWLPILLAEHPAALTVHLRTRKEMSKVPAHYELIPEILTLRNQLSPETKLIINGDIKNLSAIQQLAEDLGATSNALAGLSLSEGTNNQAGAGPNHGPLGLDSESATAPEGKPKPANTTKLAPKSSPDGWMIGRGVFENPYCFTTHQPTHDELLSLFRLHLDLFDQYSATLEQKTGHAPSFEPLKHYFKIYINTFPGSSELRARLMQCHSTTEVRQILATC